MLSPLAPAVLLALFAGWYVAGLRRLWARAGRGAGVSAARAVAFAGGVAATAVALSPPADALADARLSAHMSQHVVLMALAAPLLVAGDPVRVLPWAFGPVARRRLARALTGPARHAVTLAGVVAAAAVHVVVLWAWHVPAAYDAAAGDARLHAVEHATMLGAAVAFWAVLPRARVAAPVLVAAVGAAVVVMVAGAALGLLMTFAPRPWYAHYADAPGALADQQAAGAIMWGVGGGCYALAAAVLLVRLLGAAAPSRVHAPR